jgi:hypothetical protein
MLCANDEWGPAIAYSMNASTGKNQLVATWYDTRGDQSNNLVNIYSGSSVATTVANPFANLVQVSVQGTSPVGQTVPWNHTLATWWDYQALKDEHIHYTFLGAWRGDARLDAGGGSAHAGIWSAVLSP